MRLEIQNINKIKEADIALNGLTVIVGENDMGKSTIGRAFFSTIKAVSNMRSLSNESSANKASKHIDSLYKHFYGKKIIDGTMDLLPRVKSDMERICQDEAERNAFLDHLNAKIEDIDLSPRQKSLLKEDIVNIRICFDQVNNPAAVLKTELAYLVESEFMGQFCSSKSELTNVMLDTEEEGKLSFKAKDNQVTNVSFSERGFYEDITYVESPQPHPKSPVPTLSVERKYYSPFSCVSISKFSSFSNILRLISLEAFQRRKASSLVNFVLSIIFVFTFGRVLTFM
jgi:hypothetical protein